MDEKAYMPYMHMMGLPYHCCPMVTMPQQQLETMYPKVYFIIYPVVQRHCDMMDMNYGVMHTPTREQMEKMVDDICTKVEVDVYTTIKQDSKEGDERQFDFSGRRLLRDLVFILLLRELLHRRRFGGSHSGGYPGYYGGYGMY